MVEVEDVCAALRVGGRPDQQVAHDVEVEGITRGVAARDDLGATDFLPTACVCVCVCACVCGCVCVCVCASVCARGIQGC